MILSDMSLADSSDSQDSQILVELQRYAMKNTQRASETQKIRQQINHIKTELAPKIVVKPIRSQPKAKPRTAFQWTQRVARVVLSTGASENVNLTFGDVGKALSTATTTDMNLKILGLKVWNMTPLAASSGSVEVVLNSSPDGPLEPGGPIGDTIGTDWGNATSSPGVHVGIPDQFSQIATLPVGVGNVIANIKSSVTGFTKQNFVCDVHVLVQY